MEIIDEKDETWYGKAITYFARNSNDLEFGQELGFIEDQCDIWKEIRFGLDENYEYFYTG